jgi:hypothetical protein
VTLLTAEPVHTTIHLSPFKFQVDQGRSAKNRITEVWVFANDNNIGFASCDIHYLEEGPTTLSFRPGIRNNGLANECHHLSFV